MPVFPVKALTLAAAGLTVLGTSACAPLRSHQGYVVDVDLVNSIQPGVDTRQSVAQTLGRPTLTGQFGQGDWIYISRDSTNLAFNKPEPTKQITLRISFDDKGTVTAINRSGLEQVASISPYGKKTPTMGHHRGFFESLFGNIGTVGAAGNMGPDNSNTGGGGR
jgi:outer membrane protein assembly factor BamE (lipoprotein component of BamABCDE complex)